jgi:energy-coupling factor transporter transmembrane protein EcfT
MVARGTLITVCAVAVSFYLRFVVALYGEYRRLWRARSARIEVVKSEAGRMESRYKDAPSARAA